MVDGIIIVGAGFAVVGQALATLRHLTATTLACGA
jgi:hypothetical protein